MIEYLKKDITRVETGLIAHGCNCQGAFGSGVAGAIAREFPHVRAEYMKLFHSQKDLLEKRKRELLGCVQYVRDLKHGRVFANMFTQYSFGADGQRYADPSAIETALNEVVMYLYCYNRIADSHGDERLNLYIPKIGCGLGGLNWEVDVLPIVTDIHDHVESNFNIYICEI